MSRIKWELARRLIGRYYLVQPNNWPLRFAPVHLAHLQYPPAGKDNKNTDACQDAIEYAAGTGELPCTIESFKFPPSDIEGIFDAADADMGDKWLAACSVQELPAIATDDFRRWLESQREKPSEHIQAWFDAWLELERVRVENREVQAQWDGIKNGNERWERHEARIQADLQEKLAPAPPPRVEQLTAPAQTPATTDEKAVLRAAARMVNPVLADAGKSFGELIQFEQAKIEGERAKAKARAEGFAAGMAKEAALPEPEKPEPAPVVAIASKPAPIKPWKLKPVPERLPGYRWPLYQFLKAAHAGGLPCPTASEVLTAWAANQPPGMLVESSGEHRDELQYKTVEGVKKWAKRKQIQGAINGLLAE